MDFQISGDVADPTDEAVLLERCEEFARNLLGQFDGLHYSFNGHHVGTHDMRSEDISTGPRRTTR